MHWKDTYLEPMLSHRPGGYKPISYAESAIDILNMDGVTHRIAFFLTDGQCNEKQYLESLRLRQSKGVTLVGIGLVEGEAYLTGSTAGQQKRSQSR